MASSFMQNPQDRALDEIEADTSTRMMGAMRPAAAKPPPADTSIKGYFDGLASSTKVPANVLWAVAERNMAPDATSLDRASVEAEATRLAIKTAERGGDVKSAMRDLYGEDSTSLLDRSFDIAADMYPRAEEDQPGALGDALRAVIGGAQQGVGSAITGVGRMVGAGGDISLIEEATGRKTERTAIDDVADTVTGFISDGLQKIEVGS